MEVKSPIKKTWSRLKEISYEGLILRLGLFFLLYWTSGVLYTMLTDLLYVFFTEQTIHHTLLRIIFIVSVKTMQLFYPTLTTSSEFVISINNIEIIQLAPGCSGLRPLFRITFILFLYPIPLGKKIVLLPLTWGIILIATIIHFILLIPISYHWPSYYGLSHDYITRIIFYSFFFSIWWLWEKICYRKNIIKPK